MATYILGKFIMRVRGSYNSSSTYNTLDVVYYNGGSYVCKSDSTKNKIPTNTTYWQQLAAPGMATMTEAQKQEIIEGILAQGVVIDPDYNTFTEAEKEKLEGLSSPNNGTLTIKRNNTTVGTFGANQSGNTTININVPTDYVPTPAKETNSTDVVVIEKLESNKVYVLDACESLKIEAYDYEDIAPDSFCNLSHLPTYLYIYTKADFTIDVPATTGSVTTFVVGGQSLFLEQDKLYRVTVRAGVWEIVELQTI